MPNNPCLSGRSYYWKTKRKYWKRFYCQHSW